MKSNILILVFSLVTLNLFAQHDKQSKADSLMTEGEIQEALKEYQYEYDRNPDNKENLYSYCQALALGWDIDTAFHFLKEYIESDSSVAVLTNAQFYFLQKDERWTEIEDLVIANVEAKHGSYPNLSLSKELFRMMIKDQAFYSQLKLADKKMNRGNPVSRSLWELKHILNLDNQKRLDEIVEDYGWPKISGVKGAAATSAFLIVQHAELEYQQKYLPMMEAAAEEGEARWSSLALLIDRVNLRTGKNQIYGSQVTTTEDGEFDISRLEEPEYVNQRREEVGLGPIEEYVKYFGLEWKVPQKKK